MLSQSKMQIEELPVPVQALSEAEASTVKGGVWGIVAGLYIAGSLLVDAAVNGEKSFLGSLGTKIGDKVYDATHK